MKNHGPPFIIQLPITIYYKSSQKWHVTLRERSSRSIRKPRSASVSRTMVSITIWSTSSTSSVELTYCHPCQGLQMAVSQLERNEYIADTCKGIFKTL